MEFGGLQTLLGYIDNLKQANLHEEFKPDYSPGELKEMGVYGEVYGPKAAPRLASLPEWPAHWYHKEDPHGWLQWYKRYSEGRRMEDDERQIKRWKAFKARHGGNAFQSNPTPRRAYALRNWAIDPKKLVKDPADLEKVMEAYKSKKYEKTAGIGLLKAATTLGATKALLKFLRSEGVQIHRTPEPLIGGMLEDTSRRLKGLGMEVRPAQVKNMIKNQIAMSGPVYVPGKTNAIYLPRGKFKPGAARKPITINTLIDGEKINFNPREVLFHEGGHAAHFLEDPRIATLAEQGSRRGVINENTLSSERIANNNAINFMREQKVPAKSIDNYIKNTGGGYKSYLDGYEMVAPTSSKSTAATIFNPNVPRTSFSEVHKDPFSVSLPAGTKTAPTSFPAPLPTPTLANTQNFLKGLKKPGKFSNMFTPASKLKPLKSNGSL